MRGLVRKRGRCFARWSTLVVRVRFSDLPPLAGGCLRVPEAVTQVTCVRQVCSMVCDFSPRQLASFHPSEGQSRARSVSYVLLAAAFWRRRNLRCRRLYARTGQASYLGADTVNQHRKHRRIFQNDRLFEGGLSLTHVVVGICVGVCGRTATP